MNVNQLKAPLRYARKRSARFFAEISRLVWQTVSRHSGRMVAPVLSYEMPNSVLRKAGLEAELFAGKRKRISTCSGVAWIPETDRLVTINMHNSVLNGFALDTLGGSAMPANLSHLWELDSRESMGLHRTENIAFSGSLGLMALSNTGTGVVQFFDIDTVAKDRPVRGIKPVFTLGGFPDTSLHGVSFDAQGQLCCVTTVAPGSINVYKVRRTTDSEIQVSLLHRLSNARKPLRPKDVCFSPCGHWLAIGYTMRIGTQVGRAAGLISIHARDRVAEKILEDAIDVFRWANSVETLVWSRDGIVYATDQLSDQITAHQVDLKTGVFVRHRIFSGGKAGGLSMPHGLCLSPDDRFLIATNYGTDSISVFELKRD